METEENRGDKVRHTTRPEGKEKNKMVDLTTTSRHFFNAVGFNDKWRRRNRVVRRDKERELALPVEVGDSIPIEQTQITYITGMKYYFQTFIRKYSIATLIVWIFLFLAEGAMVLMYVYQSTIEGVGTSWESYDRVEWSYFFWCRVTLSVVLLSQLIFAYSVSLPTIIIVILTTVYQIVICLVALFTDNGELTKMYIPFFLRCWPMRQYFLFVLDSIALMVPRSEKFDLFRLAVEPLTLFICMVFSTACFFRIDQTFRGYPVNIGVALYFVIVTVSTVGFGDVVPRTPEGKGIVIIAVFVFLAQMPLFIQVIRSTVSIYKSYKNYGGVSGHFVVYGHLTAPEVISILHESVSLSPSTPLVFCSTSFSDDVLALSHHPAYQARSTFLTINALDLASLQRVKASSSSAFVMFPLDADRLSRVDDDVLLSSRIMKARAPAIPQFLWLRYGLHANLLRRNSLVVEAHMKRSILSTALLLPGIIPFLVNLIRIAWTEGEDPEELWEKEGRWDWKNQYRYSRRQTIGGFVCPSHFEGRSLLYAIEEHKKKGLLVVGVQSTSMNSRTVFLDLNYTIRLGDKLVLIFDSLRHKNFRNNPHRLRTLWKEARTPQAPDDIVTDIWEGAIDNDEDHYYDGMDSNESMEESYSSDWSSEKRKGGNGQIKSENLKRITSKVGPHPYPSNHENDEELFDALHESTEIDEENNLDAERLRECLCSLQFIEKKPLGIRLEKVPLTPHVVQKLNELLYWHADAIADRSCSHLERERIESMINNLLVQTVYASQNRGNEENTWTSNDTFVFVDLPSSGLRHFSASVYEEIIAHTLARYQLYTMMRDITSIQSGSTAVLLTMRKHPPAFLKTWARAFGFPLRYIRGQSTLAAHLTYAFAMASNPAHVRGILLYSSSLSPKDYGDIPVYTVDKALREIIDGYEKTHSFPGESIERNIITELGCFTSCIQLYPSHTDLEWIVRGKENFQDTLPFMAGRCFSANMLINLPFYACNDSCILDFFTMLFPFPPQDEVFNESNWDKSRPHHKVLFRYHREKHSSVSTFGDVWKYLLHEHHYIAFGIFRLFPQKSEVPGNLRYFVTNPPRNAPLVADDIIYCIAPSDALSEDNKISK